MRWVLILLLFLTACANPASEQGSIQTLALRVAAESSPGKPLVVQAWVEGSSGLFLTGALVSLLGPGGQIQTMNYDTDRACFRASLSSFVPGTYRVTARSLAAAEPMTLQFTHQVLTVRPELVALNDGEGNSALNGAKLKSSLPWSLSWDSVPGACAYLVQGSQDGVLVFLANSASPAFLIPGNTFSAGNISLRIQAQALGGDPSFSSADYYSLAVTDGPLFSFSALP